MVDTDPIPKQEKSPPDRMVGIEYYSPKEASGAEQRKIELFNAVVRGFTAMNVWGDNFDYLPFEGNPAGLKKIAGTMRQVQQSARALFRFASLYDKPDPPEISKRLTKINDDLFPGSTVAVKQGKGKEVAITQVFVDAAGMTSKPQKYTLAGYQKKAEQVMETYIEQLVNTCQRKPNQPFPTEQVEVEDVGFIQKGIDIALHDIGNKIGGIELFTGDSQLNVRSEYKLLFDDFCQTLENMHLVLRSKTPQEKFPADYWQGHISRIFSEIAFTRNLTYLGDHALLPGEIIYARSYLSLLLENIMANAADSYNEQGIMDPKKRVIFMKTHIDDTAHPAMIDFNFTNYNPEGMDPKLQNGFTIGTSTKGEGRGIGMGSHRGIIQGKYEGDLLIGNELGEDEKIFGVRITLRLPIMK